MSISKQKAKAGKEFEMKFEYIASINDEASPRELLRRCRAKTETLHVEPWFEAVVSENRLMNIIDSLLDLTSVDKGEDGKLYVTYQCWIDGHEGERAIWMEVEETGEAL